MSETIEYKGYIIKIEQCDCDESPRDWGNMGVMVCWHRRYDLGDKNLDEFEGDVYKLRKYLDGPEIAEYLPLYLYDHSGISMNTTGFSCSWDSGLVGFIYATKEAVRETYSCKRITESIRQKVLDELNAEVKIYDTYLTGDIYDYFIYKDGEEVDSLSEIYEYKYAIEEAKGFVDNDILYGIKISWENFVMNDHLVPVCA